jgi:hypothetical protein
VAECVTVTTNIYPRLLRFPSAIDRSTRHQARVLSEVVQQPVGFELQQIALGSTLRSQEGTLLQPDFTQRKG